MTVIVCRFIPFTKPSPMLRWQFSFAEGILESHAQFEWLEQQKLYKRDYFDFQTISMHILRHVPSGIEEFGPAVHSWWMYVYERLNSWICRRVLNRHHPEATVMETYRVWLITVVSYDFIVWLHKTTEVIQKLNTTELVHLYQS